MREHGIPNIKDYLATGPPEHVLGDEGGNPTRYEQADDVNRDQPHDVGITGNQSAIDQRFDQRDKGSGGGG